MEDNGDLLGELFGFSSKSSATVTSSHRPRQRSISDDDDSNSTSSDDDFALPDMPTPPAPAAPAAKQSSPSSEAKTVALSVGSGPLGAANFCRMMLRIHHKSTKVESRNKHCFAVSNIFEFLESKPGAYSGGTSLCVLCVHSRHVCLQLPFSPEKSNGECNPSKQDRAFDA